MPHCFRFDTGYTTVLTFLFVQDIKRRFDDKRLSKITREFPGEVNAIINSLLPGNMEWFAQLFVSLLARTALDNETDEEVLGDSTLAKADPSKLQKLHQRLSSKSRTEETTSSSSHRRIALRSGSQQQPQRQSSSALPQGHRPHQRATPTPAARPDLGQPAEMFPGTSESFFFQFLQTSPSVQFVRHVEGLLVVHISEIAEGWLATNDDQGISPVGASSPRGSVDAPPSSPGVLASSGHALDNDETVDRLVEVKLLARFLGFLTFRSHWPLSLMASVTPLDTTSASPSVAMDAALKDAIRVEERFSCPPPLKVQDLLDAALQRGQLVLLIPWLAEFLKMMR